MRQLLGRIGTAFRILIGLEPTWWGIKAEWAEIQVGAADLFQKHNALAARLAKRIKELEALEDDCGCEEELPADAIPAGNRKAQLRSRAFALRAGMPPNGASRGLRRPPPGPADFEIPPEGRWVPADEDDDA